MEPVLTAKCKRMTNLGIFVFVTNLQLLFPNVLRYSWVPAFFGDSPKEVTEMTTSPVRVERRGGQRFPYLLPVSFRQTTGSIDGVGFTQDLSSRGVFFFTDALLAEGEQIELTLRMPSEITLGESMPVRCRGRILRIVRPVAILGQGSSTKIGVAVRLEGYEYLSESAETPSTVSRVSSLHPQHEEERTLVHSSSRSL